MGHIVSYIWEKLFFFGKPLHHPADLVPVGLYERRWREGLGLIGEGEDCRDELLDRRGLEAHDNGAVILPGKTLLVAPDLGGDYARGVACEADAVLGELV